MKMTIIIKRFERISNTSIGEETNEDIRDSKDSSQSGGGTLASKESSSVSKHGSIHHHEGWLLQWRDHGGQGILSPINV